MREITRRFQAFCKESIGEDLGSLYLRGSYPRGDWVFGLSDLDFYVILGDGAIREPIDHALTHFVDELRLTYPSYHMSFRCDATQRVLNGKSKAHITRLDSRHLFGEDRLRAVPEPSLDELREYGTKVARYLCDFWLDSQTARRQGSPYSVMDVRLAQYLTLKIAQNALLGAGRLEFTKSRIVEAFRDTFQPLELIGLVEDAYAIRTAWPTVWQDTRLLERFLTRNGRFPLSFKKHLTARVVRP